MTIPKLLLVDCDGTCYPWTEAFNGRFKQALTDTAAEFGISHKMYLTISQATRGQHHGMMNFILALCQNDLKRFHQFTDLWCRHLNYSLIHPNPTLGKHFQHLPCSTRIFTNNCRQHLDLVWKRLFPNSTLSVPAITIEDTYDGHWFHPKQADGLIRICNAYKTAPHQTLLLDDSPILIKIARNAGLHARLVSAKRPLRVHLNALTRE